MFENVCGSREILCGFLVSFSDIHFFNSYLSLWLACCWRRWCRSFGDTRAFYFALPPSYFMRSTLSAHHLDTHVPVVDYCCLRAGLAQCASCNSQSKRIQIWSTRRRPVTEIRETNEKLTRDNETITQQDILMILH